jgi:hypothetical protein
VDFPVRSGIIVTEVAKKELCVQVVMKETCQHGVLLRGRYGGLGGPGRIWRTYPAKVVPAEGDIGDGQVEDQRVSGHQGNGGGGVDEA